MDEPADCKRDGEGEEGMTRLIIDFEPGDVITSKKGFVFGSALSGNKYRIFKAEVCYTDGCLISIKKELVNKP